MRTRKYRAYHDKWGWASPRDIDIWGDGSIYVDYRGENGDKIECYTEDTKELHVMDYINLKDKNGKEIYEGDILECRSDMVNFSTGKKTGKIKITKDVVVFGKGMFKEMNATDGLGQWSRLEYRTVIGNIYESNKELSEK